MVLLPDLIQHIHHFQYNARKTHAILKVIHAGVGFESGAETKLNSVPPATTYFVHITTFEALDRCDSIKDKAHMTVFLRSDATATIRGQLC